MSSIFGKTMSKRELLAHVGRIEQVGGVRRVKLSEGPGAGTELAEFRTGAGFNFTVALSRGMDIPEAEFCGQSLCWQSSTALTHPAAYDPSGSEWLRVFFGGLLTTCGMTHAGWPCVDQGTPLGLHGRYTGIAAEDVSVSGSWENDEYVMVAQGKMREAVLNGGKVALTRKITAVLGQPKIWLEDTVENEGYCSVEHMMLYHCNFGYPLLSEHTRLVAPSKGLGTPIPGIPMDNWDSFLPPTPGFQEWVYYHQMEPDPDGTVTVRLINEQNLMNVYLRYDASTLPRFVEWKMMAANDYVLGLEPANCQVQGRDKERAAGTLQYLEPGEIRKYRLEFGVQ